MGMKLKIPGISGLNVYEVRYSYKPVHYEVEDKDGNTLVRTDRPTGILASMIWPVA